MTTIAEGNARLLNVAKALRESPQPSKFTMAHYAHECGTPACALGHYIFRTDLQTEFRLLTPAGMDGWFGPIHSLTGQRVLLHGPEVCQHFAIEDDEAADLFDADGCNEALSAIDAAEYIESFVAARS